jgi:hypothetical protein
LAGQHTYGNTFQAIVLPIACAFLAYHYALLEPKYLAGSKLNDPERIVQIVIKKMHSKAEFTGNQATCTHTHIILNENIKYKMEELTSETTTLRTSERS